MSLGHLLPGPLGLGAHVNSGPVPFALQKRMRLAAQRALSWTPRESSVWVSTLPAPAWTREASWPRRGELAGGPGSTDCQTPPPPRRQGRVLRRPPALLSLLPQCPRPLLLLLPGWLHPGQGRKDLQR